MISPERLTAVSDHLAFWVTDTSVDPSNEPTPVRAWEAAGLRVRVVRGAKCRTVSRMFDEVSAAWQFPEYFGENWPAFSECLGDMDWLDLGQGIVFAIRQPDAFLVEEPARELEVFVEVLAAAHADYREAVDRGEWWDRPPVAFHVVLQTPPTQMPLILARWRAAGARVRTDG